MNKKQKTILLLTLITVIGISIYLALFHNKQTKEITTVSDSALEQIINAEGNERERLIKKYAVRTNEIDVSDCNLKPPVIYIQTKKEDIVFTNKSDKVIEIITPINQSHFIEPNNSLPVRPSLRNVTRDVQTFSCFSHDSMPNPNIPTEGNEKARGFILISFE